MDCHYNFNQTLTKSQMMPTVTTLGFDVTMTAWHQNKNKAMKQVVVYTPEHLSVQQVLSDRANPERAEEKEKRRSFNNVH